MTSGEIKEIKQKLYEIQKDPDRTTWHKPIHDLANEVGAPISITDHIDGTIKNIHTVLQTEMMFNACASAEQSSTTAKRACIWAAVAAIAAVFGATASCISVVLYLFVR